MIPSTPDIVNQKFTGKERDSETGLDFFEARYYSGPQGRFTSPDEFKGGIIDPFSGQDIETNTALPYADITDPQTLNKYAYVRNAPLRYVDPDGHADVDTLLRPTFEIVATVEKGAETTAATGLGLLGNVVGAVGMAIFNPSSAGGKDEIEFENSIKSWQQQHKERAEEQEDEQEKDPEPQTSTSGAGARKGRGNDARQTTSESTTLEGSQTRREDISAEQAGMRKQGRGDRIRSIEKTK